MLRKLAAGSFFLWCCSTFACSLTGLEHVLHFSSDDGVLPAFAVRSLADWNVMMKQNFPSGGRYAVFVRHAYTGRQTTRLAMTRLKSINAALDAIGVEAEQTEHSEVDAEMLNLRSAGRKVSPVSEAYVVFQPACPHACCPGPEPIR